MQKSVELCQLVSRAINHTTWTVPRMRDGDRWQNIHNPHLVENPTRLNGHDRFEEAIFRAGEIMKGKGWNTEITDKPVTYRKPIERPDQ